LQSSNKETKLEVLLAFWERLSIVSQLFLMDFFWILMLGYETSCIVNTSMKKNNKKHFLRKNP